MATTRIADLPNSSATNNDIQNNTYIPINVHPNPYGYDNTVTGGAGGIIPQNTTDDKFALQRSNENSLFTERNGENLTQDQMNMLRNTPVQRIPSRDIHVSKADYIQDESSVPNYIPPTSTNTYRREQDYVKQHILDNEKKRRDRMTRKNQSELFDSIWEVIQIPFMISTLFFIFQYPFLDKLIFRRLNSEMIVLYESDGNMSFYGNLLKSVIFGVCIYFIIRASDYIASI
jgi:hypothetical protein